MSDLDDKLTEILQTLAVKNITREHPTLVGDEIESIKQAFSEAGYITTYQAHRMIADSHKTSACLTGQEWYDRFIKTLDELSDFDHTTAIKAAKRASGLSDD